MGGFYSNSKSDSQPQSSVPHQSFEFRKMPFENEGHIFHLFNRCNKLFLLPLLSFLQIISAITLLIFGAFRFAHFFVPFSKMSDSRLMLDFEKVEDYASTNEEGVAIIGAKLGPSVFVPALLQLCAALFGFCSNNEHPPKYLILVHIAFSAFSILLWLEPLYLAALEINLSFVQQLNSTVESQQQIPPSHIVWLSLFPFSVIFQSAVVVHSASRLCSPHSRTIHSSLAVHLSVLVLLLSAISTLVAALCAVDSMSELNIWTTPRVEIANFGAFYALGLKELVFCSFTLAVAVFSSYCTVCRNKSRQLGAMLLQGIALFALVSHLLNGDRLSAVTHNTQVMLSSAIGFPINARTLLSLYTAILLLALLLALQFVCTAKNVFQFPPLMSQPVAPFVPAGSPFAERSAL